MFAGLQIPQRMPFLRVHLQLIGFIGFDQHIDELRCVKEVHILIDQSVDD